MRLNCIFDSKQYRSKPSGKYDFPNIHEGIAKAPCEQLTIDEFLANVGSGRTYVAGDLISRPGRCEKGNIKDINFFSVDIDNKEGDIYTNFTPQNAIEAIKKALGTKPLCGYETFSKSNPNGSQRFRLIYGIEEATDSKTIEAVLAYLVENSGGILDNACKNASRLFLGTCNKTWKYDDYILLSQSKIKEILDIEEQKKLEAQRAWEAKKKERMSQSIDENNDILEELKAINLGQHLSDLGYDVKLARNGYKLPCPIHSGKNDNFHINQVGGAWLWTCFSKCGGIGGTIIDLHSELNNVDTATAIAELCRMYSIERRRPHEGSQATKNAYSIERYISDDIEARNGILESLKQNRRILLTGAMGCGKTHFVSNDLYAYAKAEGKKLVMVIPGVKQLNNLEKNKGIHVVCDGLSYNGENDRVATTPESLLKVIKELQKDSFILVVDESHERYTSLYRNGYKDKNIEKAEQLAYKTMHITATPRPLVSDRFDEVIEIKTETAISNNITILKLDKKGYSDNVFAVTKDLIKAKRQTVLFNNNKEENGIFAELLKEEQKITVEVHEEGQLSLLETKKAKKVSKTKTITSVETVHSGKKSEAVQVGRLTADLTCTTSSITAGLDLETKANAVLVANTKGMYFDNLIQLIGRFRSGIDVVLLVSGEEEAKQYFDLEDRFDYALRYHRDMAEVTNRYNIDRLHASGVKKDAYLIQDENGKWIVDEAILAENIYKKWSEAVFSDTDRLKQLLEEQTAFNVKQIVVAKYNDEEETTISEIKEATREEKKRILAETSEKLLELDDNTLYHVLQKDFIDIEGEVLEVAERYFAVADKHIEKIQLITKELFTDSAGITDEIGAFRKFYNEPFTQIKREIRAKQAREINRLIKEHGTDFYLDKSMSRFKTSADILQAKIRHELSDLEKKRGRISSKALNRLIEVLVKEGYVFNKHTKTLLDQEADIEAKKEAHEQVGKTVNELLENIYNFDTSGKLQSVKM